MLLPCYVPPGNTIVFPLKQHLLAPAKAQVPAEEEEDMYSVPDTGTSLLLLGSARSVKSKSYPIYQSALYPFRQKR